MSSGAVCTLILSGVGLRASILPTYRAESAIAIAIFFLFRMSACRVKVLLRMTVKNTIKVRAESATTSERPILAVAERG